MAKLPTYEEMGKKVAEEALDGYTYKGKTLREWIDILSSLENQNKWIPVSERLPEQDKSGCSDWHSVKVFAQIKSYTGKTEIVKGCFIEFGDVMAFELDEYPLCIPDGWDVITLDKDNRAYNEEYPEEYVELQAWMPLPEPYKQEAEE